MFIWTFLIKKTWEITSCSNVHKSGNTLYICYYSLRVDEQLTSPVHLTGPDYEVVFSQIVPICSVLYLAWSTSAVVFPGTQVQNTGHHRHAPPPDCSECCRRWINAFFSAPPSRCFCWVPLNKFKVDPLQSSRSITDFANLCSRGIVARSVGTLRTTGNWVSTNLR